MSKYKLVYPHHEKYNLVIYASTEYKAIRCAQDTHNPRGGSAYLYKVALFDPTIRDENFISRIA